MSNGDPTQYTNGNGGPWGLAREILRQSGVLGLLLVVLIGVQIWDGIKDREERQQIRQDNRAMWDSLTSSHRREAVIATAATEALRVAAAVQDKTNVILRRMERGSRN